GGFDTFTWREPQEGGLGPAGGADMLPLIVGERASNAPETGDFAVPPTDYVVAYGETGNTPEENEK
ncbi:MAG: heme biosynthesis protein HemY, partial [Planctomycetes bacterium]|nr:heme biosynthesis protein HemY [Planctomycetota bacterium]